jgi:hypothetical protein
VDVKVAYIVSVTPHALRRRIQSRTAIVELRGGLSLVKRKKAGEEGLTRGAEHGVTGDQAEGAMMEVRRPPRTHRRAGFKSRLHGRGKAGVFGGCGRLQVLAGAWLLATLSLLWYGHRVVDRRFSQQRTIMEQEVTSPLPPPPPRPVTLSLSSPK